MTLLAILSGGTFVHYLFGGSVPIMGVFLTMVGLDLFTGYAKALKSHTWAFGLKIAWLQKWLRVFEQDVGEFPDKDDQENNVQ